MATKTLVGAIQLRHDTADNWASANPILKAGEIGIETNTNKMKIGNGSTNWSGLAYFGGTEENSYVATAEADQSDTDAIAAAVGSAELHDGDTAIVKRLIAGDKYSYTAYVYDEAVWKAMDGNYSAENVYFDEDLTYTAPIGVKTVPSSGSGTISAEGKSVSEVLKSILAEEKNPKIVQPTMSVASSQLTSYEVGTNVNVSYTTSTTIGSYEFGPATGVTFSDYAVTLGNETLNTATGTFAQIQVTDDTNLSISATCVASDGTVPKTNLGNSYTDGMIKSKTLSASKGTLTGYRNCFYGYKTADNLLDVATGITSANMRALNKAKSLPSTISTNGMQQMFFAVLAGKKVAASNAVNGAPCTMNVAKGVMIEGANGYDAKSYDVYYVNNAAADSGANTYKITVS